MPNHHTDFQVHPLYFNGHLQTVFANYLPSKWKPKHTNRRMVKVDHRDHLVVHDNCPDDWQPGDRVVVMVHGLGGSHQSGYMQRIAAKLNHENIRSIRVDMRGFGASMYTCRGHAHVGRSDDLEIVIQDVIRCCPRSPITLVGFSFGGNIVLKLLAEYSSDVPVALDSAAAVSPPIDLHRCSNNLRTGLARFYDSFFTWNLSRLLWKRRRIVGDLHDVPVRKLPKRLRNFDEQFTAPLNGFSDAAEYYTMCSTAPLLDQICVPTLLLTAHDDPLIPVDMFEDASLSPAIELVISKGGGHLGFLSRNRDYHDRRWMDCQVVTWVKRMQQRLAERPNEAVA